MIVRTKPARPFFVLVRRSLAALLLGAALLAPSFGEDSPSAEAAAREALQGGKFSEAAALWEQALEKSRSAKDDPAQLTQLLGLAKAYQGLGQQNRAAEILSNAVDLAEKLGDPVKIIEAKIQYGLVQAVTRQTERAEKTLRESLQLAREKHLEVLLAGSLNNLGNLLSTQNKFPEALASFKEAAGIARAQGNPQLEATALCNAAATATYLSQNAEADKLNTKALESITKLPPDHDKAFLLLTSSQNDARINPPTGTVAKKLLLRSHDSARQALEVAESIHDRGMASYALGQLGRLYEFDNQLDNALSVTRRAAFAAQQAHSPDALYRWEWQAGRILKRQGKVDEALASYRGAVQTLQPIRHDVALGYGNAAVSTSFRQSVGPLFFEMADLLFTQADREKDPAKVQAILHDARDTVEQLKAVELEDYFQDECVNVARSRSESVEQVDPHSAVIYVIPLPDRTEVLVGLSSGLHRFTAKLGADALTSTVREFRRNLETRTTYGYLEEARQLYDLLIRPLRPLLLEHQINTLVFVPDGALQTIPLASLHDGNKFLIEEFAVAVTPGLSLVQPRPIERKKAEVLLAGLSTAVQGFPSLDFVPTELENIEKGGYRSETLLDNSFVTPAVQKKLGEEQFSIVHMASHGQFNRDARKTFVLTYDGRLTLNNLEALIRPSQYRGRPVELLVLSACQTAAGDDRAALGLAGVAVKAGARSAVASLWFVNDQSTAAFVSELYAQLRGTPAVSRAKAVRQAQIKMLQDRRYDHPCYWAPYLLIGNWL